MIQHKKYDPKICPVCLKKFEPKHHNQVVCEKQSCKHEAQRRRCYEYNRSRYEYKIYTPICTECGEQFKTNRPLQKNCGKPECKKSAHKKRNAINNAGGRHQEKPVRMDSVRCKCPRCERYHMVRMIQSGPRITPRIFCPDCKPVLGTCDDDFLLFGDAYSVNIPRGISANA